MVRKTFHDALFALILLFGALNLRLSSKMDSRNAKRRAVHLENHAGLLSGELAALEVNALPSMIQIE
jgi:hypothetical protein